MQYKLRTIVYNKKRAELGIQATTKGITIPNDVAVFFDDCFFTIERSGTCIICKSGVHAIPTKQEIQDYDFEDVKI